MVEIGGHSGPLDRADVADLLVLQRSGLFDGAWFIARNLDLAHKGADPLGHFHRYGWRENRWPNAYFEPAWYIAQNADVAECGKDPLLHYAQYGEAEGRCPIAHFDPAWYRRRYSVPSGMLCLAHFLQHRTSGTVSPIPEFDAVHYISRYPDVAAAGMDPFEHYLVQGALEDRVPSADFDPVFYRSRYLANLPGVAPLLHYREHRHTAGVFSMRPEHDTDIPQEVRRNTRASPLFEELIPLPAGAERKAKLLAFYLPQFHPVPENDTWWGKGFTEWTNVARALPRFVGHYQPRIPRDLGHYSLEGSSVLRRQAEMARAAGLHGFVFYFYWFDGRRLLDGPLDALLNDPSIDLPFCLMWANENWTRRWDGSDHEVLLAQNYDVSDEPALAAALLRYFADPRYIRLESRPVLMVYRAGLIPDGAVARWRSLFAASGENPIFIMSQSFDDRDPRQFGMDAAVEFPPHKLVAGLGTINRDLHMLDRSATAQVFAYEDIAFASDLAQPPYPLIRTALPGWDNDARRQGAGMVLHGATPSAYQNWLERLISVAQVQRIGGEALVCINAWNEWGEGAYLEPDVHFGAAFLNATGRAVAGHGSAEVQTRLLLVGHDAFPAGAQLLLLNVGRALREVRGLDIAFLLLGGGALLEQYQSVAPTLLASGDKDLPSETANLVSRGFTAAIVNTSAAARMCPVLANAGVRCTLLVHELPRLLRERNLVGTVLSAVAVADSVVFGALHVRDRFAELVQLPAGRAHIMPQGLYRPVDVEDRAARRARLRIPDGSILAMGLGYADLRKGFDLFMQAWRVAHARRAKIHMLWVGDIDPTVHAYLGAEMAVAEATGTFHHIPFSADGADWLAAADVHLLTSREDPLPTVVMEAMSAGVPTIAFEEGGGAPDLLRDCDAGVSVPLGDVTAMVRQIRLLAARNRPDVRTRMARQARELFDFDTYTGSLLKLACPGLIDVSVVVPNYNYGRYLEERLTSIFAQTHPVSEVIVLDDASTDDSHVVTAAVSADAGRRVRWVASERNSGSVFRQWRRAAELARSDWIWIAEADDLSEPRFLGALAHALRNEPEAVMAFTDSSSIDGLGARIWADYKGYYKQSNGSLLAHDAILDAQEMLKSCFAERNLVLNVSAVLWKRSALLAALDGCESELETYRLAGDWRLYVELLLAGGRVCYVAEPLNIHRRHRESVTGSMEADRHLAEVARMQQYMRTVLGSQPVLVRAQRKALAATRLSLSGVRPTKRTPQPD